MAKKRSATATEEPMDHFDDTPGEEGVGIESLDFNVEDEYKPDPLIPKGLYHGAVIKVEYVPAQYCIVWTIALHDNGGVMNDGETPIDGAHVWFRNWLPKPGDENELTKSGKNNKRQSKINMLKDFSQRLNVDMSTPQVIAEAIANAEWVGLEVSVEVDIDEYQGRFRNQANRVDPSKMF